MSAKFQLFAVTAVLFGALTACSTNMSKGKAEELIKERFNPKAYCRLKEHLSDSDKPNLHSLDSTSKECIQALKDVGAIVPSECAWKTGLICRRDGFKEGPRGRIIRGNLSTECGSKEFVGVTSITTENRTATVKYTWKANLDNTKASLSDCKLYPIEHGENEATTTFKRDDDGNWIEQ